jgi:hypothetical protein
MGIGNIIHKIISFTKSASVKVSHVFAELVGSDKAAAFGHAALDVLKTAEGKVVLDAVIALQAVTPALSGESKLAQVKTKVASDFAAMGKEVPSVLLNMLIEVAVGAINGHFADAEAKANDKQPIVNEVK